MLLNRTMTAAAAATLLVGASTMGQAQQQDRGDRSRQRDRSQRRDDYQEDQQRQSQSQEQRDRQRQEEQQSQGSEQDRESRYRISPSGWVRVATDLDNDGSFDAVETIFYYDLQRAREASRQRANRDEGNRSRSDTRMSDRSPEQETVRGEVAELHNERFAGMDDRYVIARVETDDGSTAKACLGTRSQVNELDLREGDRVTIRGVRGHINDKSMLIAKQISSGNDQISIDMPSGRGLKRVQGDIRSTRTTQFHNHDDEHVIAEVELVSGKRETVNFGPKSRVNRLDLQPGNEVSLLVRPGRINGEPAMIAEQIRFNNRTVELPRPEETSRFGSSDRPSRMRDSRTAENRGRIDRESQGEAVLGVLLDRRGNRTQDGVEIQRVVGNSPADRSALQEGDQIISINGQQIDSYRDITRELDNVDPRERVDIRYRRNGRTRTTTVQLAQHSDVFDN